MAHPTKYPPLRALTEEEKQWVANNLGLARTTAYIVTKRLTSWRRQGWKRFDQIYEDLYAAGVCGLCIGVQRHRSDGPAKVSTYSTWWIRSCVTKAVSDEIDIRWHRNRHGEHTRRVVVFSELEDSRSWSSDKYNHDESGMLSVWDSRPVEEEPETELDKELATLLALTLRKREQRLIRRHVLEGATVRDVAKEEGITHQRVSQIIKAAVVRLRKNHGFMRALEKRCKRRRALQIQDFPRSVVEFVA